MVRRCNVIVVGCGPVGLVMTLALLKRGIPVTALESLAELIEDQRASLIQPPSLEMALCKIRREVSSLWFQSYSRSPGDICQ